MKNELVVAHCAKCNAMVKVLNECKCENCGIKCCGEEMEKILPNVTECAVEKHIPQYERVEDDIFVKVPHVMEKEHYIEWIALVADNKEEMIRLYPEQNAEVRFKYIPGSTIYAFCNKHGLWKNDVK